MSSLEACVYTPKKIGSSLVVEVNVLDSDIVVSVFELHSCNYSHLETNTLGKGMKLLYPPVMD